MKPGGIFLLGVLALVSLASCARNKGMVVLLPDPDGKVGRVVISNQGGTQVLNDAGHMVEVPDADKAPLPPVPMGAGEMQENFGEAMSIVPPLPIHFVLYFKTDTTEL